MCLKDVREFRLINNSETAPAILESSSGCDNTRPSNRKNIAIHKRDQVTFSRIYGIDGPYYLFDIRSCFSRFLIDLQKRAPVFIAHPALGSK